MTLKPEQLKSLEVVLAGSHVIAVLPTGFGKSVIYQLLPFAFDLQTDSSSCVLVVSPLVALMVQQVERARRLHGILLFSIPLRKTFFSKTRDSFSRSFHSAKQICLLCIPWPRTSNYRCVHAREITRLCPLGLGQGSTMIYVSTCAKRNRDS